MKREVKIGDRWVGDGHPVFVVAEVGINHNGDLETALKLVDAAAESGCDAVKLQKRTPRICTPPRQREQMRQTPWGYVTYLEYRERVELDRSAYALIDEHCRKKGIAWFASCWDEPSIDFIEGFAPPC